MMPVSMASNNEKSHLVPLIYFIDLRNAMVPLTILFASHDAKAGANGVT